MGSVGRFPVTMPIQRPFGTTLLCLVLLPAAQAGEPEARDWLERMGQALTTRNYDGTFFHLSDSQSETMRIVHQVRDGRVTERLVSLDGSGREIIRNDQEVVCYLPDKRTVLVEKRTDDNPLLAALPSYSEGLEAHYEITLGDKAKVLGRKTRQIAVRPKDEYRYGYHLWLDDETAMPLKSQLRDREGKVLEQILFAKLELSESIEPGSLTPEVEADDFEWLRQDRSPAADASLGSDVRPGWRANRLPPGFDLTASRIQAIAGSSAPVQHLVFSDGLASVSVFIESRHDDAEPLVGLHKVGSAHAFSVHAWDHQVTAVGEVPAGTVEMIAQGVAPEGQAGKESGTKR